MFLIQYFQCFQNIPACNIKLVILSYLLNDKSVSFMC